MKSLREAVRPWYLPYADSADAQAATISGNRVVLRTYPFPTNSNMPRHGSALRLGPNLSRNYTFSIDVPAKLYRSVRSTSAPWQSEAGNRYRAGEVLSGVYPIAVLSLQESARPDRPVVTSGTFQCRIILLA